MVNYIFRQSLVVTYFVWQRVVMTTGKLLPD